MPTIRKLGNASIFNHNKFLHLSQTKNFSSNGFLPNKVTPKPFFASDDTGYLKRRLEQLAEEARPIKDDPKAGKISGLGSDTPSADDIMNEPGLSNDHKAVLDRIAQNLKDNEHNHFLLQHQRAHAIATKIPNYVPKHSRDIAMSEPWRGSESDVNLTHRMLQDTYKPLKTSQGSKPKLGVTGIGGNIPLPKMTNDKFGRAPSRKDISARLSLAREKSLDYEIHHKRTLDKSKSQSPVHSTKKESSFDKEDGSSDDGPSFRELYRDRFLGPSTFAANLSAINSLASQRIEDAMARGEFDGIKRGVNAPTSLESTVAVGNSDKTKIVKDHNVSSPYIDTTEYFLNKIIKQQGAAPIWIDKQGSLKSQIEKFRNELATSWVTHTVHLIDTKFGGSDKNHTTGAYDSNNSSSSKKAQEKIKYAQKISSEISQKVQYDLAVHNSTSSSDLLQIQKSSDANKPLHTIPISQRFIDKPFESKQETYLTAALSSLNGSIRSYNLQAPGVARWQYLQLPTEYQRAYRHGCLLLVDAMKRFVGEKTQEDVARAQELTKRINSSLDGFKLPDSKNLNGSKYGESIFEWKQKQPFYEEKEEGFLMNQFKEIFKIKLF